MNNGIHVSFSILVWKIATKFGIARSYGIFIPSFLRNLHTIFHKDCINLHSHQQCKSISFSPHPLQHLLFVDFLLLAIPTSIKRYFTVVWIVVSLIISDVEHLFKRLWAICTFSMEKYLDFLPLVWWGFLFAVVKLCEMSIYFGN